MLPLERLVIDQLATLALTKSEFWRESLRNYCLHTPNSINEHTRIPTRTNLAFSNKSFNTQPLILFLIKLLRVAK